MQSPVHTPAEKQACLQGCSNPVCASQGLAPMPNPHGCAAHIARDSRESAWTTYTTHTSNPAHFPSAVVPLCPRDDRVPDRHVFGGFGADRFRTALTRACTAAGIATFSPHDLRHRRVSLLHAQGLTWARIGEVVGHTDLVTSLTAR